MVIDSHAHIFPVQIAEKASVGIGGFYGLDMRFDGTVKTLLEIGERAGIDKFVVHSVATIPEQVGSINNFIIETVKNYPGKLIGYAAMHPEFLDISGELERVTAMGLKGIKIHPDFQRFNIDSDSAMRIYECAERQKLPVLIHTGDYRYEYSKPARLANVLDAFPKLDVIAAHFGGWSEWDGAKNALAGKRLWVDTSSSLYTITPAEARGLVDVFGADMVLFGTDYPMWDASEELERLDAIGLNDEEKEKILHINTEKLLNLC